MYLFGGKQPVRNGGVYADYRACWTEQPPRPCGPRPFRGAPSPRPSIPRRGFVQNSNEGPWTSTFPQTIDPAAYPAWIAPIGMQLRPQHGATFLLSQAKFTAQEVNAGKESTKFLLAARILPDLLTAARNSGFPDAQKAASVLAAWDQTADADSKGGPLFERWYELYVNAPKRPPAPFLVGLSGVRGGMGPKEPLDDACRTGERRRRRALSCRRGKGTCWPVRSDGRELGNRS